MPIRRRLLLVSLPVVAIAIACASEAVLPGDLVIGMFDFHAQADWPRTDCKADGGDFTRLVDGGFDFSGTFSRDSVDGGVWFSIDGFSRTATFDAPSQRYVSTHRASAQIPSCGESCKGAEIEETISVVVLSDSQDESIGSRCGNLPDAGLPDGSVPGPTVNGYDAERACGELKVTFLPGKENCKCVTSCTAVYGVEGKRRFNGGN
ncbi:hypothetical protein [Archangium sp.]|uniref:hypothetical protein n=1 Tax=Archangium sp. TaxID=1872627 RepID=UPI00389A0B2C